MDEPCAEPHRLDLRGVACPLNFVKTKLLLDKLAAGALLEVWLDGGEPLESVSSSVQSEGHKVVDARQADEGYYRLLIEKAPV